MMIVFTSAVPDQEEIILYCQLDNEKSELIDISHHTQLFVDDYLIEGMTGLERKMHPAEKHPANPMIMPEQPVEIKFKWHYTWDNGSVVFNAEQKVFQAYWRARGRALYAVSEDGITWHKPDLGQVFHEGTNQNNMLKNVTANTVVYNPKNKEYPYLSISDRIGRSKNGLEWEVIDADFFPRVGDSGMVVYDPFKDRYIAIRKDHYSIGKIIKDPLFAEDWDIAIRVLGISTSRDGFRWTPWRELTSLFPDEQDHLAVAQKYPAIFVQGYRQNLKRPEFQAAHDLADKTGFLDRLTVPPQEGYHHMQLMNMIIIPYHNLYIGLFQVLNATAQVFCFGGLGVPRSGGGPGQDGTMEVQLVSSRDLIHWERLGDRQPFIPLGTITDWDRSMIMPFTSNHIVRDGKLSIYYGGSKHAHRPNSYWNKPGEEYPDDIQGMGLATIREDGFISLDADASGGVITTKPVRFDGNRLVINADATEGSVDIEVLDRDGNTITGYKKRDCNTFSGDATDHVVTWRNRVNLASLRREAVRFRFHLKNASIYSFALAE